MSAPLAHIFLLYPSFPEREYLQLNPSESKPILLILDNHTSHATLEALKENVY